jgi:DNA-binding beta-propeller fold protein YncE
MKTKALAVAAAVALAVTCAGAQAFHRLESATPLKAEKPDWDYLSLDAQRGRLFIAARGNGLMVYDTKAKKVLRVLPDSGGVGASVPVPELDRLFAVKEEGELVVYQLSSLEKLKAVKLGEDADGISYDPATSQVAIARGDSRELTFVDARSGEISGRIAMPARKLEAAVADGKGLVFIGSRDRSSVFKVDPAEHKVLAEYPAGCDEANGLAIDRAHHRLFVGCRGKSPVLAVMDADSGKVVAKLEIGRGNDGVIFDPDTKRLYASGGVDGNLVVYRQTGADEYELEEATTTRPYARTMALDPKTKKVYLVTAEGTVDPSRKVNKGPAPFYPNTYFPGTFTLLTYAPK